MPVGLVYREVCSLLADASQLLHPLQRRDAVFTWWESGRAPFSLELFYKGANPISQGKTLPKAMPPTLHWGLSFNVDFEGDPMIQTLVDFHTTSFGGLRGD